MHTLSGIFLKVNAFYGDFFTCGELKIGVFYDGYSPCVIDTLG